MRRAAGTRRALQIARLMALTALLWLHASPARTQLLAGSTVASFGFNLSNPGARSLGMGGAFAGVADDATAAYSNPAALTILASPEVSYEARQGASSVTFFAWRGTKTAPTGEEEITGIRFDAARRDADSSLRGASFVSASYARGRWAIALYGHQLADLRAEAEFSRGEIHVQQVREKRSTISLDVSSVALSAAYRVTETFSIGATVAGYRGRVSVSEIDFSPRSERSSEGFARIDDSDVAFHLGLMLDPHGPWSVGAYYRGGATFDVTAGRVRTPPSRFDREEPAEPLRLPDVFGVGVGYRVTQGLLLAGEWSRVSYSRLDRAGDLPVDFPDTRLVSDDADEIRLGLEYSFWNLPAAPAVRFGVWLDPEHSLRAVGPALPCPGEAIFDELSFECRLAEGVIDNPDELDPLEASVLSNGLRAILGRGEDEIHYTAGFGLVLGSRLQMDAAVDFVDSSRYSLSLSGVFRF